MADVDMAAEAARMRTLKPGELLADASPRPWSCGPLKGTTDQVGVYDAHRNVIAVTGRVVDGNRRALDNALVMCSMSNGWENMHRAVAAAAAHTNMNLAAATMDEYLPDNDIAEQVSILTSRMGAVVAIVTEEADERDQTIARIIDACLDAHDTALADEVLGIVKVDTVRRRGVVDVVREAAGVGVTS